MKNPAKTLDKEFRAMGASRQTVKNGVEYQFTDGCRRFVPHSIRNSAAVQILNDARNRYGNPNTHRSALGPAEKVKTYNRPNIDLENLVASDHAKERLTLMRRQVRDLTFAEILQAIRDPQRVMWSHPHRSWIWVGERIAVAVTITPEGVSVIRTLLWATEQLWEDNPRPERPRP